MAALDEAAAGEDLQVAQPSRRDRLAGWVAGIPSRLNWSFFGGIVVTGILWLALQFIGAIVELEAQATYTDWRGFLVAPAATFNGFQIIAVGCVFVTWIGWTLWTYFVTRHQSNIRFGVMRKELDLRDARYADVLNVVSHWQGLLAVLSEELATCAPDACAGPITKFVENVMGDTSDLLGEGVVHSAVLLVPDPVDDEWLVRGATHKVDLTRDEKHRFYVGNDRTHEAARGLAGRAWEADEPVTEPDIHDLALRQDIHRFVPPNKRDWSIMPPYRTVVASACRWQGVAKAVICFNGHDRNAFENAAANRLVDVAAGLVASALHFAEWRRKVVT
jgi:hypothetical protein